MASPPLPPTFDRAPVAHPLQGQVVEVPAEVRGQGGRVLETLGRLLGETLPDDVREPDAHPRMAADEGPGVAGAAGRAGHGERLADQEAEGEDVGPAVHGGGDGPPLLDRLHRRALLRRHPARRPAEPIGDPVAGGDRRPGQVEVEQHRLAVGGDQDVRRLDVHVHVAAPWA